MLEQILFAFLATFTFSIIFEIRGKNLIFASFVGATSWAIFIYAQQLGATLILSYFISSLVLTFLSELFARLLKTPVTSILISGLIPLVPGSGIYYTMYYILERDMEKAIFKGAETLFIAGALSFGVVVISSLFRIFKTGQKNRYSRGNIPKRRYKMRKTDKMVKAEKNIKATIKRDLIKFKTNNVYTKNAKVQNKDVKNNTTTNEIINKKTIKIIKK